MIHNLLIQTSAKNIDQRPPGKAGFSRFLTLIAILFFVGGYNALLAQCVPDDNCVDTESPGQICPAVLPDGYQNQNYEQTITIIPPASFDFQGNPIYLSHIQLASIGNLPPGLMWETNASGNLFAVGTKYCAKVYGIPDSSGTFQLEIGIYPYVNAFPMGILVVDDTSLVITIHAEVGIDDHLSSSALKLFPNPFENNLLLEFNTPFSGSADFQLFDELGRIVFSQKLFGKSSQTGVEITLPELARGTYSYLFKSDDQKISGRLIKVNP